MTGYIVIIIVLLTSILSSSLWQAITLYRRSKKSNNTGQLNDSKYNELKYRIEYLTTIVPVIIVFLGVMGYREIDNITSGINAKIDEKVKPKFDSIENHFANIQSKAQNVNYGLDTSKKSLFDFEERVKALQTQQNIISGKDVIQQNIYIVSNLKNDYKGDWKTYNFKDMVTVSGNKLPDFKKPPFIISVNDNGHSMFVCDVTTGHFRALTEGAFSDTLCIHHGTMDYYDFSVLIMER